MSSIGLVMYVKDEEAGLENAILSAIQDIDEIVIWITGGSDRTIDIAKKYATRLYMLEIPPEVMNFGVVETMTTHLCGCSYVLRIDGDETIENSHLLKNLAEEDHGAWRFPRYRWADLQKTQQLEKDMWPDYQYRFFSNDKMSRYEGLIHPEFKTPHLIGTTHDVFLNHFIDPLKLTNPKRVQERKELYQKLAIKEGKNPEGSEEAMRLGGHNG